jgi:hypothetical protein
VEGEGAGANFKPGVFEVKKERKGLHSKRDDDHSDYGPMTVATTVPDEVKSDHKHAVIAKTNDNGYAGVIFMPSHIGGDTYRLRAYVGPETLGFQGDTADGPVVESGTMTVWRNIRFCGYHRKKLPANAGAVSAEIRNNVFDTSDPGVPRNLPWVWANRLDTDPLYDTRLQPGDSHNFARNDKTAVGDANWYRPVTVDFKSLTDVLRQAFCELVLDVNGPAEMSVADYRAAIQRVRNAARDCGQVAKTVDWNYMILDDPTSPWAITTRSIQQYNNGRDTVAFPQALAKGDFEDNLFVEIGMIAFAEQFTEGGLYPGLSMIHMAADLNGNYVYRGPSPPAHKTWGCGGFGGANGAFFMVGACDTDVDWVDVPLEGGVAHEGGHCLFHIHGNESANGGADGVAAHQALADFRCVMDYSGCYGEFCGRCNLKLRGWKTVWKAGEVGA